MREFIAGLFKDEEGKPSMGRTLLVAHMLIRGTCVVAAAFFGYVIPAEVWATLRESFPWLVLWAGGPRVMQYLSAALTPALSAVGGMWQKLAERVGGPSPGYRRPAGWTPDPAEPGER